MGIGATHFDAINASGPSYGIIFDEITVYPSPYIVLSEHGYTKHFYAGGERIATLIGDGGLQFDYAQMDSQRLSDITRAFEHLEDEIAQLYHSSCTSNVNIDRQFQSELQYCEGFADLIDVDVSYYDYLLGAIVDDWNYFAGINNEVYFTHSDHLGSASWITDGYGEPVQYIHYAPYGEFIANQQAHHYDERFKFTGKERDAESGYDYFGARHYDHRKGIWHSVDPLADKYIHQSPYIYCNGNPIMLVDPDGREVINGFYHQSTLAFVLIFAMQNVARIDNSQTIFVGGHGYVSPKPYLRIGLYEESAAYDYSPRQLASLLREVSSVWRNHQKDKSTPLLIVLMACNAGKGDESFAKQLSELKSMKDVTIIAPTGLFQADALEKETEYDVNCSEFTSIWEDGKNGKQQGSWNIYRNGEFIGHFEGTYEALKEYVKLNSNEE